ncbi:MAG: protein kinase [Myxococcota bacterium]|nr:protein kinase [Myxococcota bacterium]
MSKSIFNPVPFGSHLLLERINVGGMAEVFRAKAFGVEGFQRFVAIKRILPQMAEDSDFIRMFIDEARIASQLNHNNIVQIYELGKEDDIYFIAMEYITGRDLRLLLDRLKRQKRRMSEAMACYIISRIAEALDYAHRKKSPTGQPYRIIHRDVSPQNLLISYEGEVKLCDFGIAKAVTQSQRTQAGVLKGKFAYMSPEQVKGQKIDHRSDLFALGVIFYELLTGQRLFLGESDFSTLEAVRSARVPNPKAYNIILDQELENILMKMLAKLPKDRYQDASQIFHDLQTYLVRSQQLFHSHHLREFMQKQYAREINLENSKLEGFSKIKAPRPESKPANEPRELDAIRNLRESEDDDFDSHVTGEILQVPERDSSTPASETDDIPELSSDNLIEASIQTDEFAGLDPEDAAHIFDSDATAAIEAPDFSSLKRDSSAREEASVNTFECDDSNQTIGDDGLQHPDLAAEIQAAQAELRVKIQATEGPSSESQITEYKSRPLSALLSRSSSDSDDASQVQQSEPTLGDFAPDYNNVDTGVGALTDNQTDDSPPQDEGQLAAMVSKAMDVKSGDTWDSLSQPAIVAGSVEAPAPTLNERSFPHIEERASSINEALDPSSEPIAADFLEGSQPNMPAASGPSFTRDPKLIIGVAGLVAAIVVVVLVLILGTGNEARVASLTINSAPTSEVSVYVDGKLVGTQTPITLNKIARGTHEIRIEAPGFQIYRQPFEIQEYQPHTLSVPLITKPNLVKKKLEPKTATTDDPAVDVQRKGNKNASAEIAPQNQKAKPVTASNNAVPTLQNQPNWSLNIRSVPNGANVLVDGKLIGRTPLYRRGIEPSKTVKLALEKKGFIRWETSVPPPKEPGTTVQLRHTLKAAAASEKTLRSEARVPKKPQKRVERRVNKPKAKLTRSKPVSSKGYLVITTIPRGLPVSIDGRPTGLKSPFRDPYSLTPGRHLVEIIAKSGKKHSFNVLISAGGTTKLVKRIR